MGQYKVPQNVETEDKILGPLSVKQFIYVIIGVLWAFLMWRLFSFALPVAIILALPVSGFFLLLGFGQREGVPFEDYIVAFFRFLVVPRQRVWMKDESKDVLVVEAKKPEANLGVEKHVSVGQLKQLASIIDSRGSFKDPSIQLYDDANAAAQQYSQRVIGPAVATSAGQAGPVSVANQSATQQDDVLDEASQRSAQVGALLQTAETNVREQAVAQLQQALQNPAAATAPAGAAPQAAAQPAPPAAANPAAAQIARHGSNLPVNVLAQRAAEQHLAAGQSVSLRPGQ